MSRRPSNLSFGTFAKFKPLMGVEPAQVTASFDQMAKALQGASFTGVARFTLIGGPQEQSFALAIHGDTTKIETDAGKVDLEIITTPETWLAIAQGTLAPLDAFTRGQLRVRGDQTLGQRIVKRLAAAKGSLDFC